MALPYRASAGALLLTLLVTCSAAAQTAVTLSYEAPAGCPSEAEFVASVASRGGHFQSPAPGADARGMRVAIHEQADGFSGELHVRTGLGPSAVRRVQDPACSEVVDGLAVVAAIALGATPAESAPSDAAPAENAAPRPTDASPAAAAKPARTTAPVEARRPRLRDSSFIKKDSLTVEQGTLRFERDTRYTLAAGAAFGLMPSVLPRFDLKIAAVNAITPPDGVSHLVGPILHVRWSLLGPGSYEHDGFSTDALGLSAGVGSCSAITYDSEGFVLLACGEFEVGVLNLETKSADGTFTQSKQAGFGTAGLGLAGQYNLGRQFYLDLHGGGHIRMGEISAQRPDGSDLFEAGLFGGYAMLGVGLHFW